MNQQANFTTLQRIRNLRDVAFQEWNTHAQKVERDLDTYWVTWDSLFSKYQYWRDVVDQYESGEYECTCNGFETVACLVCKQASAAKHGENIPFEGQP